MTLARFVRRISGSVNSGRGVVVLLGVEADAHARARPGRSARRAGRPTPATPARSAVVAPSTACCSGRCAPCRCRSTVRTPGTVIDVSATFVLSTMRRPRCGWKMRCCSLRRQPGVQRQDLGVVELAAAQEVGGVVDLPLAGQEHERVAVAGELVDGVADRLHLVAAVASPRRAGRRTGGSGPRRGTCDRSPRRSGASTSPTPKWRAKRAVSIVADVTMTLRSGRRGSSWRT